MSSHVFHRLELPDIGEQCSMLWDKAESSVNSAAACSVMVFQVITPPVDSSLSGQRSYPKAHGSPNQGRPYFSITTAARFDSFAGLSRHLPGMSNIVFQPVLQS